MMIDLFEAKTEDDDEHFATVDTRFVDDFVSVVQRLGPTMTGLRGKCLNTNTTVDVVAFDEEDISAIADAVEKYQCK